MKKSIIAILTAAIMILSFLGPSLYNWANAFSPDPSDWYMQVNGVLGTDSYVLYPYQQKSLKLGFSKFGELVNNETNVGLEYDTRDPFAPPAGFDIDPYGKLPKKVWINGWFLDLTYNHSSWGLRNLWAGALFSDLSSYSKPWLQVLKTIDSSENFLQNGYEIAENGTVIGTVPANGGRKTNGTATTEPIQVLYHGPRKFIAYMVNHIFDIDQETNDTLHIVDVMFTIIFNKVKKEIVVLKEVKIVDQAKYQISSLKVQINGGAELDVPFGVLCQFSNREEWDLGTATLTPKYASYVHFFTNGTALNDTVIEGLSTVYDKYWTLLPTLPTNVSISTTPSRGYLNAYGPEPNDTAPESFDLAQIISNDKKYVGFAGYWPSLSDWQADAGGGRRNLWYRALLTSDPHDIDAFTYPNDEPFLSPLTVGEWDFMLADDHRNIGYPGSCMNITTDIQFRAVTVYGVTDWNDGDDANMGYGHINTPDKEVMYQLDEVFNPWDLNCALDKEYARWVTKADGNGTEKSFYLEYSYLYPQPSGWPYVNKSAFVWSTWDAYCTSAERVLVDGVLKIRDKDYILDYNHSITGDDTHDYMRINFTTAPANASLIKILFSADIFEYEGAWEWLAVGRDSAPIDAAGALMVAEYLTDHGEGYNEAPVKMAALDMQDATNGLDAPFLFSWMRAGTNSRADTYRDADVYYNMGRAAFKDDWSCHKVNNTWYQGLPISSAGTVFVGGPSANLGAEYFNDFTDVLATMPGWTGPALPPYELFATTCWSKHLFIPTYNASGQETIGWGLISTYKDINGTIGLIIYGYTGQDTLYTSWSLLHSDVLINGIKNLPCGVTTLILQFNYTLHPTDYCFVKIAEALGTISEFNFQQYWLDGMGTISCIPPGWETDPEDPNYWITAKYPTIHPDPEGDMFSHP